MMKVFISLILICSLAACNSTTRSTQPRFPKMYTESPTSILVVPAINNTTAADATMLYASTITKPLSEAGYYVYSLPFVQTLFANEGIIDGRQVKNKLSSKIYRDRFAADSILYVTITQWDTNYYVVGGNVTVGAHFELVSTYTNETLWQYQDSISYDTSSDDSDILLVNLISTAIESAMTDYAPLARDLNRQIISTMPLGRYHPNYNKEQHQPSQNALELNN